MSSVVGAPYSPQLQYVLERARCEREFALSEEGHAQLRAFRERVHSKIVVCRCADGREGRFLEHFGIPISGDVVCTFHRAGVMLQRWSDGFVEVLENYQDQEPRRDVLFFIVLHDAREPDLACKAWKDQGGIEAALKYVKELKDSNDDAGEIHTVILRHDTDLVVHYEVYDEVAEQWRSIAALAKPFGGDMAVAVAGVFPSFPSRQVQDLAHLFEEHCRYVDDHAVKPKTQCSHLHEEKLIVYGRKFDYLTTDPKKGNQAFLIDKSCGGNADQTKIAAHIVADSLQSGRVRLGKRDRILLLVQECYHRGDLPEEEVERIKRRSAVNGHRKLQRQLVTFLGAEPKLLPYVEAAVILLDEFFDLTIVEYLGMSDILARIPQGIADEEARPMLEDHDRLELNGHGHAHAQAPELATNK